MIRVGELIAKAAEKAVWRSVLTVSSWSPRSADNGVSPEAVQREGIVSSDPEAIAAFIKSYAPNVIRIGLETGPTATWLWTELQHQRAIVGEWVKARLQIKGRNPQLHRRDGW